MKEWLGASIEELCISETKLTYKGYEVYESDPNDVWATGKYYYFDGMKNVFIDSLS